MSPNVRTNLRRSHEDAEAFTGRLSNLRQDIAARQDTSGDKFSIELTDSYKRAMELEAKVGAPFEKEERYQELSRGQSEIEEKLDLTKHQAPSQVDVVCE